MLFWAYILNLRWSTKEISFSCGYNFERVCIFSGGIPYYKLRLQISNFQDIIKELFKYIRYKESW